MRPDLEDILDRLKNDSLSSSSEMVQSTLDRIMKASATEEEWLDFSRQLRKARPSMAPFYNMALQVDQASSAGTLGVHKAMAELAQKEKAAAGEIAKRAAELKGDSVITLSYSGTVLRCLLEMAKDRKLHVIVLESLPMGEGAMTCAKLAQSGVSVEMVDDSMSFVAMAGADLCLVGADAVTADGVVNKIGTANLALAARQLRKDVYVVTSTLKVAPITEHDLMPSEEGGAYLKRHQVFELTPLDLFADFITDEGKIPSKVMIGLLR
jgi:translation initiation factor eIF-2B subunit delta